MDDNQSMKIKCEECGNVFKLASDIIGAVNVKTPDGVVYKLTYFICPQCKKKFYVQVDNEETKSLLQINMRQFMENAHKIVDENKPVTKRRNGRYKSTSSRLQKKRNDLLLKLENTPVTDIETGIPFTVRFTKY